jgi:hypothetical protein
MQADFHHDGMDSSRFQCGRMSRIEVPPPAITYTVTVQQLVRWANGSAVNPDERMRKNQLKAFLSAPKKEYVDETNSVLTLCVDAEDVHRVPSCTGTSVVEPLASATCRNQNIRET